MSNIASQICTEKGKKTLNVDHVIQALRQMKFENHIKLLTSELDLAAMQQTEEKVIEDNREMKDLINKHKKKKKNKKKNHDFYDEDLINEQNELFEKCKQENFNLMFSQTQNYFNSNNVNKDFIYTENNKKMKLDNQEEELFRKKSINEEEDFD